MDLKWAFIAIVGVLCLIGVAAAAWLIPVARSQRSLRPLANLNRLLRLPEYQRIHRRRVISLAIVAGMLLVTFLAAIVAAARPVKSVLASDGFDAASPRDIMLCVGQPVTDPTTADFFRYYADQTKTFTNQAIGITSDTLRAMPLTRDHAYAEDRLRSLANLAQIQQGLNTHQDITKAQKLELAAGIESFTRNIQYKDYAQSLEDILAQCMTAFDTVGGAQHRRQLVYIGWNKFRNDDEKRKSLFDSGQVQAMAQRGGIQVNVISRADTDRISEKGNDTLRELAKNTGGIFAQYNPAGTSMLPGGANGVLNGTLDKITANPPRALFLGFGKPAIRTFDAPTWALSIAVFAATLMACALAVLRR